MPKQDLKAKKQNLNKKALVSSFDYLSERSKQQKQIGKFFCPRPDGKSRNGDGGLTTTLD